MSYSSKKDSDKQSGMLGLFKGFLFFTNTFVHNYFFLCTMKQCFLCLECVDLEAYLAFSSLISISWRFILYGGFIQVIEQWPVNNVCLFANIFSSSRFSLFLSL